MRLQNVPYIPSGYFQHSIVNGHVILQMSVGPAASLLGHMSVLCDASREKSQDMNWVGQPYACAFVHAELHPRTTAVEERSWLRNTVATLVNDSGTKLTLMVWVWPCDVPDVPIVDVPYGDGT